MSNNELLPMLEAVLFAMGEPIEIERLCVALELDEIVVKDVLDKLQAKYEDDSFGICLLRLENKYLAPYIIPHQNDAGHNHFCKPFCPGCT